IENIEIITNPSAKYDPEGMGGIINIVLKKNKLRGFSGMVNLSAGTGDKYKGDIIVSYRNKKINLYTGIDYSDRTSYGDGLTDMIRTINDTLNISNIDMDRDMKRKGYSIKLGADYFLNDKNVISLEGNFGYHQHQRKHTARSLYSTLPATTEIYTVSSNDPLRESNYYKLNLNYQHKIDNKGQELTGMISYSSSEGESVEKQDEVISNASWVKTDEFISNITTTESEKSDNLRLKLDYVKPLKRESRFEAGLQSRIEGDFEDYLFNEYDTTNNIWANNPLYNSNMNFDLNIHSAYALYLGKKFNIDYQFGLRGEYTDREISHKDATDTYKINRLDYFPTIHFSKQLNKTNQVMASYTKKIERPRGWFLDPFTSYMNAYNIRRGNPELEPEYIDSYEIAYQKKFTKSFISVEGYYRKVKNKITRIRTLQSDGIVLHTFTNLNNDHSLGFELMSNMEFYKWLRINASGNFFKYRLEGDIIEDGADKESYNYDFRLNTTFLIKKNTKLQLTGFYSGPSVTSQGTIKEMYGFNAALRHDFMKNRASVSLNVRDIFGTMSHDFITQEAFLYTHTNFGREPRVITLSLSYKINNYKSEKRQGENGEGMEMDIDF
ncbi:MAG: TonB-dependent receptor, partial [Saprospiraceae bacterium]|nr:TonB-dependent receptor [Saprospiraceae bacterium]